MVLNCQKDNLVVSEGDYFLILLGQVSHSVMAHGAAQYQNLKEFAFLLIIVLICSLLFS